MAVVVVMTWPSSHRVRGVLSERFSQTLEGAAAGCMTVVVITWPSGYHSQELVSEHFSQSQAGAAAALCMHASGGYDVA